MVLMIHTDYKTLLDDNDWIADHMINPQNYNEQHSSFTPYELYKTSSNENDETNN